MWKIQEIIRKVVDKGPTENIGDIQYACLCKTDDPFNQKRVKVVTFVKKDDAEGIAVWDNFISTKQYPPIRIKKFVVGDPATNAADKPLPSFQLKRDDGTFGPINTSLSFHAAVDENGMLYRGGTPRQQAMRLIEQLGRLVNVDNHAEVEENAAV